MLHLYSFRKVCYALLVSTVILLFTACSTTVCTQENDPFATYTFSDIVTSSINVVEANTVNSSITISGDAESEAVVEMYVSGNGSGLFCRAWSDEEINQYLEYTVEVKDGKLLIVERPKNNGKMNYSVSFKISIPKQMNSNMRNTNGSVKISNLYGSQNIQTVNGSLTVENVSGKISGRAVNGSITVTDSGDDIDMSTINGSITETGCTGKVVLNTVNGSVRRDNVQ